MCLLIGRLSHQRRICRQAPIPPSRTFAKPCSTLPKADLVSITILRLYFNKRMGVWDSPSGQSLSGLTELEDTELYSIVASYFEWHAIFLE
jgi:hypothetical protein